MYTTAPNTTVDNSADATADRETVYERLREMLSPSEQMRVAEVQRSHGTFAAIETATDILNEGFGTDLISVVDEAPTVADVAPELLAENDDFMDMPVLPTFEFVG